MTTRKTFVSLILALCLCFAMAVPVFAVDKQNISYWYSDETKVKFNPYDGSYSIYNYSNDSNFSSHFYSAIANATNQWNNVLPLGIYEASVNYSLNRIYGGEREQLKEAFPNLKSWEDGKTLSHAGEQYATVSWNSKDRYVYRMGPGSRMCIVDMDGVTANSCKTTALHEMGHLYGWHGHSTDPNSVMYYASENKTVLTASDKNHLKQIYDLFY